MVEVTQEDRDAGAVWGEYLVLDSPDMTQAFARHRTTALAAKEAENAELRDMIATLGENAAKAAREYSELIAAERAKVEKLREVLTELAAGRDGSRPRALRTLAETQP